MAPATMAKIGTVLFNGFDINFETPIISRKTATTKLT